jgi:hypothetical protein
VTDDRLGRLLDLAVPDIPDGLRTAPLAAVRRRARRRRAVLATAVTGGAAFVVLAALAVALPARRDGAPPGPGITGTAPQPDRSAGPTIAADPTAVRWVFARIDRADRVVTVFANPADGDCVELVDARATFRADAEKVVVTVHGATRPAADCTRSGNAVPLPVTLADPLDARPVFDAATGRPAPVYPDRVLPNSRGSWHEPGTSYLRPTGDSLSLSYTRAGGPDLLIRVVPADGPAPSASAAERISLGGHPGLLAEVNGVWTLRWRNNGFDLTLRLIPNESITSMSRAEAVTVLEQLDWPA